MRGLHPEPAYGMLRVNLIAWNNSVGLGRDIELLGAALASRGMAVHYSTWGRGKLRKLAHRLKARALDAWHRWRGPRYDLTIMLEHVRPEYLSWARRNVFVPNPEFCKPEDVAALVGVDAVFAKTREGMRIFDALGTRTAFVGFTSPDRLDRGVARKPTFFHLAGRSGHKGTQALLALWRAHPHWPTLTVVQSPRTAQAGDESANIRHLVGYLPDAELRRLQNANRFHLCPSQTEGFGHYLVEAMSVGAVTLTLDAPPMNELVRPDRGILVPAHPIGAQRLATLYGFDADAMAQAIQHVIDLDEAEVTRIGDAARAWYEDNAAHFAQRLAQAVDTEIARGD
jgi:glycosyltransferase involved in cell wall biosynthesis